MPVIRWRCPDRHARDMSSDTVLMALAHEQQGVSVLHICTPVQAQRQHPSRARQLYSRALRVDANHLPSLLGLAVLESRSGNITPALRLYQRGLAADSRNVQILHATAQLHQQLQQPKVRMSLLLPAL